MDGEKMKEGGKEGRSNLAKPYLPTVLPWRFGDNPRSNACWEQNCSNASRQPGWSEPLPLWSCSFWNTSHTPTCPQVHLCCVQCLDFDGQLFRILQNIVSGYKYCNYSKSYNLYIQWAVSLRLWLHICWEDKAIKVLVIWGLSYCLSLHIALHL